MKRMDTPDTVDAAIHFLAHLQSEGWGVRSIECHLEHVAIKPGGRKLPVEATLTVRLTPGRG